MNHQAEEPPSLPESSGATPQREVSWEFDHLNVTAPAGHSAVVQLVTLLGLSPGYRPPFRFPGEWFYQGQNALLHMVEAHSSDVVRLNHIAFRSQAKLEEVLALIKSTGLRYQMSRVPEAGQIQVFIQLLDSLVLELDIPMPEGFGPLEPLNSLNQLKELRS